MALSIVPLVGDMLIHIVLSLLVLGAVMILLLLLFGGAS